MQKLNINKIHVKQSRVVVFVSTPKECSSSNKKIANEVIASFPNLKLHKCKNISGRSLIEVLDNTSIAHIVEHIIIDLQIQSLPKNCPKVELFGFTEQIDSEQSKLHNVYKIEISYYDDLVCLNAINKACEFINQL